MQTQCTGSLFVLLFRILLGAGTCPSLLGPAFLWTWSPFPKSLLPSQRTRPHSRATADIGPVLTLCLCSSAILSWGRGWPRWHQGVFLHPGPEGTAPQCEGLVRLDARLPRHLESSAHVPGSALTVSQPVHSFSTPAGFGQPVFPVLFSVSFHPQPLGSLFPPSFHFGFTLPWTPSLSSDVLGYFCLCSRLFLLLSVSLSLSPHNLFYFVLSSCSCSIIHFILFMLTVSADSSCQCACERLCLVLSLSVYLSASFRLSVTLLVLSCALCLLAFLSRRVYGEGWMHVPLYSIIFSPCVSSSYPTSISLCLYVSVSIRAFVGVTVLVWEVSVYAWVCLCRSVWICMICFSF